MGVSLEQYRAAIGLWAAGRPRKTLPPRAPIVIDWSHAGDEPNPEFQYQGPWKLHALLLAVMMILILIIPGSSPSQKALPDTPFSWKPHNSYQSHVTTLLLSPIAKQALDNLLLISGVEPNPGPTHVITAEEKETVVASLIVSATDEIVKKTLRIYDVNLTTKELKRKFNGPDKDHLVKTMDFLGVPDQQDYNKPTVVNNLISRIQSFFPDTCSICREKYATQFGDTPLLECAICGQGAHTPCLPRLIGIEDHDPQKAEFTNKIINLIQNVNSDVHFLCGACSASTIPSPESGRLRRARLQSTANDGTNQGESGGENVFESAEDDSTPLDNSLHSTAEDSPDMTDSGPGDTHHEKKDTRKDSRPICRYYKNGTCRHGISGKGCPHQHPKACKILIQHGNRGPRGCRNGNKCEDFHPKMCPQSLIARECLTLDCPLRHVAGTKRTTTRNSVTGTANKRPAQNHRGPTSNRTADENASSNFLEAALQAMEARLMTAFDNKIESKMLSLQNPPPAPAAPIVPHMPLPVTHQVPMQHMNQPQNPWMSQMPPYIGMGQMTYRPMMY